MNISASGGLLRSPLPIKKGTMTPEAKARRRQKDHERYMRSHDERLAKQRAYYREHPEYYKQKAREWEKKKREEIIYE